MINKVVASADEAVRDIRDGAAVAVGGFGYCGVPENLIRALARTGIRGLITISDDAGMDGWGLGVLLQRRLIRRMTLARAVDNSEFERQYLAGEIEVNFVPLGTLAERLRAAGCGIAAFYTPTGYGTVAAEGKEIREFNGRPHLLEQAITGDFSLVAAWRGDRLGNLVYRRSARNLNPIVATAGRVCIAEVEELAQVGELEPEGVHTPGIYVHRLVVAPRQKGK